MGHEGGIASWWKRAKCNRKAAVGASTWGFPERFPGTASKMGTGFNLNLTDFVTSSRIWRCKSALSHVLELWLAQRPSHITALRKNLFSSQGHFPRVDAMNRMMSECVTHVALVFRPVAECLEYALTCNTQKRRAFGKLVFVVIMLDQMLARCRAGSKNENCHYLLPLTISYFEKVVVFFETKTVWSPGFFEQSSFVFCRRKK